MEAFDLMVWKHLTLRCGSIWP